MTERVVLLPPHFDGTKLAIVARDVLRHAADGWPREICLRLHAAELDQASSWHVSQQPNAAHAMPRLHCSDAEPERDVPRSPRRSNAKDIEELFGRAVLNLALHDVKPVIRGLSVSGDVEPALAALKMGHLKKCRLALTEVLTFQMDLGEEGNADAADEEQEPAASEPIL